ncbi:glutaredoxin family protein [Thalassotalea litorea]|uniref:Glutaredoxin family protein n=1 Tax=Thalassotalea litorea TaxID=2020715 RepID=A0A5R9IP38_9GAMM|nr:glutaredoxin family protein [Thalassotalea litorea]TLU66233.1 glutaredoxin family protein [Thalassotalea litorea]
MNKIYLYGTAGCHLCDLALALCNQSASIDQEQLEYRDIVDDPVWLEKFKNTIPVIEVQGRDQVLGWPFDLEQLNEFIDGNN